jgi:hypothetical protein
MKMIGIFNKIFVKLLERWNWQLAAGAYQLNYQLSAVRIRIKEEKDF